ncbi:hypothetical protein Ait01nite_014820 [Actinoplanes italicus]|uniref:Uncharacterized protein n=1 Tax=Actinoplanes italicus TaxID=113567 RepID=A0A2T0KHK5_9ACTN|nr:hypothetical protein [Actinoplanes italicus]PRX22916.1 hypothetical protein CLV67_104444 [Actinoplanes italicus]GIE28437.1 hypothetical protein Ait01nite_014820 [Actinoplanes italicus]
MPDEIGFPLRNPADAKAWFYLERRADIEEWAAQRDDAAALLVRYLRVLETPLSEMADDVGADVDLDGLDEGRFRVMGLRRQQWSGQGFDVAVTVEWDPKTLLSTGKDNPWPFVAVRHRGDRERFKTVKAAFVPVVKRLGGASQHPWAYWRFQKPATGAVDPEQLTRDVLAGFRQLWDEAATILG